MGFQRLFLFLLAIVMCNNLKWSRPLALERGKRWRNIRYLYLMEGWTIFVDKHEEGLKKKKKNPFRDQWARERKRKFVSRDCRSKLWIIYLNFEPNNSLD